MSWDIQDSFALFAPKQADHAFVLPELQKKEEDFRGKHLILNLLDLPSSLENLEAFAEVVELHRKEGKSFVIVHDHYSYEELPETLPIVPSVQEAHDLIEMEEIERDLGL